MDVCTGLGATAICSNLTIKSTYEGVWGNTLYQYGFADGELTIAKRGIQETHSSTCDKGIVKESIMRPHMAMSRMGGIREKESSEGPREIYAAEGRCKGQATVTQAAACQYSVTQTSITWGTCW